MRYCFLLLQVFFLLFVSSTLFARTIYVPTESPTIQGAIDVALDEDIVMVLPGVYNEHNIDFLGKAITVTSTDPMNSSVVASTIIDANSEGRVFYFHSGEETTSILSGFTIRGGFSVNGGGIRCLSYSSPTITRNVITENIAEDSGGGVCITSNSDPIVSHNTIAHNRVSGAWGAGGGITTRNESRPLITNNVISDNSAAPDNWGSGGGIYGYQGTEPLIDNNTITGNSAVYGGGIACYVYSVLEVSNTILWGNNGIQGKEVFIGDYEYPSTFTIDYSDVEGGQSSIFVDSGCILNWGDGMLDTPPDFSGDGYHLNKDSPLRNAGDPDFIASYDTDIDGNARVLEGTVDIGVDEIKVMTVRDQNPPGIIDPRTQIIDLE